MEQLFETIKTCDDFTKLIKTYVAIVTFVIKTKIPIMC